MRPTALKLARHALAILATVLLGLLVSATMVRLAPGFDVDAQQLDSRLTHESVDALRAQRAANSNVWRFYIRYVGAAAHGDFGTSLSLNRSVRELIVERFPATAKIVACGLIAGWLFATTLAAAAMLLRSGAFNLLATALAGLALCIPSAVLGLLFVLWQAPASLAIACVVFPKAFRYIDNILSQNYKLPHVITARAKGLGRMRVLLHHVLPVSASPLIALIGVSVSIAIGAAIPVEALCGTPGIGQLAWQAAMARDLPLLVTVTMLVMVITLSANALSDLLNRSQARAS
jgi:peptide/nickel transport system permease protein